MQPRYNVNEDFYEWVDRNARLELQKSIKKINSGQAIDTVLEEHAQYISKCILHAIFINIKNSVKTPYDAAACRAQYQANTPKNYQAAADHILE